MFYNYIMYSIYYSYYTNYMLVHSIQLHIKILIKNKLSSYKTEFKLGWNKWESIV